MPDSAWFVGSIYLEESTIEINGSNEVIPEGYYYLRHPTNSLSLIDQFENAIQNQEATALVRVTQGRRVRITASNNVAIDWLIASQLRDMLGWSLDLVANTNHAAPNCSPLLWSPGWPATPATVLGTAGYVANDQAWQVSADGTSVLVTTYSAQVQQDFFWSHILAERLRVAADEEGGGTFHEFHEQTAKLGYSMLYYETIEEEDGSTTGVTWNDFSNNRFGPYTLRMVEPRWYQRVLAEADLYGSLTLPVMQIDEYT